MSKEKKIYLLVGGAIFLALSVTMLFLYINDPAPSPAVESPPIQENTQSSDEETASTVGDSLNISSEDDVSYESTLEEDDQIPDEDLRSAAREAIDTVTLNSSFSEPSEQSFYEHSYLNQYFANLLGDHQREDEGIEEPALQDEAKWVSKELLVWLDIAIAKAQFTYNENDFLQFIERENFVNEDDRRTITLLNELKKEEESVYARHLEFQYIKPYIWSEIQDTLKAQDNQMSDETDEDYIYRLYLDFENEVMSSLIEKYPELMQD